MVNTLNDVIKYLNYHGLVVERSSISLSELERSKPYNNPDLLIPDDID